MNNNSLYHHGILGMKWGKKNGPPYPLSNSRKSFAEKRAKAADDKKKEDMKKASKNRRLLSGDELRSRIERIKLEQQLKSLTDEEIRPGRKFVSDILSQSGKKVAATITTGAVLYAVKTALTGKFDIKDMAGYVAPKPKNK